jgi:hypothetical protein
VSSAVSCIFIDISKEKLKESEILLEKIDNQNKWIIVAEQFNKISEQIIQMFIYTKLLRKGAEFGAIFMLFCILKVQIY